ncbi:MAG: alpha/beta fold hydrolase [Thermomicrobiales bacterium]
MVRKGIRGGAPVVRPFRSWRWSPSKERGWRYPRWTHQEVDCGDAAWFARIALAPTSPHPPVVLVHGLVVSGSYFQPVAECLADDFNLFVPDLPGTGRSRSRSGFRDIEASAEGLGHWMDLYGLTDAMLVSNSVGCQVLTMLAAKRPELVRSLVLVSPTMDPDVSSIFRVVLRALIDIPREDIGLWKVWLADLIATGPRRGLRLLRMSIDDPQLERLTRVNVQVVVVGGERDPIVPERWVRSMAERLPSGRAVVIPMAPHAMNFTSPRRLAWIIRAAAGAWPVTSAG